jgi:RNA polymerase sigma-70 factor (ECF subfamily)
MTLAMLDFAFGGPPSDVDRDGARERPQRHATVPGEPSDDALVARTKNGDRDAFELLVRRYHVRLVAAATSMLGARAPAEDIVQEVLLRVWMRHAQWEPVSGAAVYFFGAVANRVRNVWRDRDRERRSLHRVAWEQGSAEADRAAADVADVWEAVGKLPERWRHAIIFRYVRDLEFADVGAKMGISENAAKKVIRRALDALNEALRAGK